MFVCCSFPLSPFICPSFFLSNMKSQPCRWCQGVRTDRLLCQEQGLGACFRWGKRGSADGKKKFRGARGMHTAELWGKCRDQRQLSCGRGKDFFPWVWPHHPACVGHLEYPVEALLLHSFWLRSSWRCRRSGHVLLLSLFTPSATADPLDWSQDYRISKS